MRIKLRGLIPRGHYRQGFASLAVAIFLAVFGISSISYALILQPEPPPQPKPAKTVSRPVPKVQKALGRSEPVSITIADIEVYSPLIQTGLKPDGSPAVPEGDNIDKASWLTTSMTPGEKGTSVILGHVDSYKSGPSVFYNLGKLVPGQTIAVARADGSTATFVINSVQAYDRAAFPSQEVYGHRNYPALHLITCGGQWDPQSQEYSQNIVVYAALEKDGQ